MRREACLSVNQNFKTVFVLTFRKKEKMISCVLVADLVVSLKLTSAQNFPQLLSAMVESYIHLCDDKDSDVRMVADENLNRIIRVSLLKFFFF